MKFIHTADWHFDRPFEGLSKIPESLTERLSKAKEILLNCIVSQAINHQVDAVIISGDTFHLPKPTLFSQTLFMQAMEKLNQAEIPVFLCFGNHDYYEAKRYWFKFPDNVHLFTTEEVTTIQWETKQHEKIAITGFSYQNRWIHEEKTTDFPNRLPDVDVHIGVYHGELANGQGKDYAPFTLQQMQQKGYDYWALGHIHQSGILNQSPYIVYPGTPMGHTKKETGNKGVVLAEINNQHVTIEWLPTAPIHWRKLTLSLDGCKNKQQLLEKIQLELSTTIEINEIGHLVFIELEHSESSYLNNDLYRQQSTLRELLEYFQRVYYQQTKHQVWVADISLTANLDTRLKQVHQLSETELNELNELTQEYIKSSKLDPLFHELYNQPILAQMFALTTEKRQEIALAAKDIIVQKLGGKSDAKN